MLTADDGGVRFEDVVGGGQYDVSTVMASLLRELRQPEDRDTLVGAFSIPDAALAELERHGMLIDATSPLSVLDDVLVPVAPAFARTPARALPADAVFVGIPYDAMSVTGAGAAMAPAAMRIASDTSPYALGDDGVPAGWWNVSSAQQVLRGMRLSDPGDVRVSPGDSSSHVGARIRAVAHVCSSLELLPVFLGGDHSITWWTLLGLDREPVSVLHLDAHTDLAAPPPRGFLSNASVVRAIGDLASVRAIVTVGVRGFLPNAQPALRAGHRVVTLREFRRVGTTGVLELLPPELPCYVSLDVDALDPAIMPATNVPVPGGFRFDELEEFLAEVGAARRIVGMDVVELNPARDPYLTATRSVATLILSLLAAALPVRS